MIRVGPRRRIALKTTTLAIPAGRNAEKRSPTQASGRHGRPGRPDALRKPGHEQHERAADHRPGGRPERRVAPQDRCPKCGVDRPADRGEQRQQVDDRGTEGDPRPGGDDQPDAGERQGAAAGLVRVSTSAPLRTARSVITGVEAMSRARSPAGMSCSAIDHRIW